MFTINKFLISWGLFNLIPLFFSNSQVEKIWYGDSCNGCSLMSFTTYWDRTFKFNDYSLGYFYNGISGWVNTGFLVLFVWMLFGLYLAYKRGAIYKDPYTGKTIYEGPTKTTEL